MKSCSGIFIGLLLSVSVSAESLLEGRVRLASGQPVADAQVRIFDYDQPTAESHCPRDDRWHGVFRPAVSRADGAGAAGAVRVGAELPQSVQSLDDYSLPATDRYPCALGGV